MKFSTLLLLAALTFIASTEAFALKGKQDGYIITNSGKKIEGKIKARNITLDQIRIRFYGNDGTTKVYKPSEIQGYGYKYYGETQFGTYDWMQADFRSKYVDRPPFVFGPMRVFLEIEEQGEEITLYNYYINKGADVEDPVEINYYLERKSTREFVKINRENFLTAGGDFFSYHPEIPHKLGGVNYRFRHMYKVVREYNRWFTRQQNS